MEPIQPFWLILGVYLTGAKKGDGNGKIKIFLLNPVD
jgi:hypothetical protein